MANIGNLGKTIVFSTSDTKILTFDGLKQTVSGKWARHDRIQKKAQSEFLGADLRKITLTIVLSSQHGVRPRATMESIEAMVESGLAETLVIGGKRIGNNKWIISSMSEAWDIVMSHGELAQATLNLNLEEYL